MKRVAHALKPAAAPFMLTAINAYSVVRQSPPTYDVYTCTNCDHEKIRNAAGELREVAIYTSAFTFRELKLVFEMSGFNVEAGYACEVGRFARTPLTVDATEVMIVGRRAAVPAETVTPAKGRR